MLIQLINQGYCNQLSSNVLQCVVDEMCKPIYYDQGDRNVLTKCKILFNTMEAEMREFSKRQDRKNTQVWSVLNTDLFTAISIVWILIVN